MFRKKVGQLYRQFISLEGPAERIALSYSVGSFIGVCPYIGTHTILSLLVTPIFRLNFTALYFATWVVCNPITGPIAILGEYEFGRLILGWPHASLPRAPWAFSTILSLGHDILIPMTLGWIIGGIALSLISYPVVRALILRVRKKRNAGGAPTEQPDR